MGRRFPLINTDKENFNSKSHNNKQFSIMNIEFAQQRSRLLRRLPRQIPQNDKRGVIAVSRSPECNEGEAKQSHKIAMI